MNVKENTIELVLNSIKNISSPHLPMDYVDQYQSYWWRKVLPAVQ